jgi:soluble lytic murein transglycosylase-like protein
MKHHAHDHPTPSRIPRGDRRRRSPQRDVLITALFAACAAALLVATSIAAAQPCAGPLPNAQAAASAGGEKFRLIAEQCAPVLAEPARVHRSPLLGVYDRGASVTVHMSDPPAVLEAPVDTFVEPPAPPVLAPLDRNGKRVLSLAPALMSAAREHGLDPLLLHAIAHVESRHNPGAVSPAGARGVMQVMPATGKRFGAADAQSLMQVHTNVRAAAAYLRTLVERYGHDLQLMLAAYNAGEGAVARHKGVPPYPETQAYVRDVMAIYRRLSAEFKVSPDGALRRTS